MSTRSMYSNKKQEYIVSSHNSNTTSINLSSNIFNNMQEQGPTATLKQE